MTTLQSFRLLALVSASALLGTLGPEASAQPLDPDDAVEATPLLSTPPTTGPVSVNASFRNGAGHANLIFNQDGTYLFSGSYSGRKPLKDLDVVMAVRASTGATLLFRYVADASSGVQWSKQGSSDSIRDFWSTFAAGDKASGPILRVRRRQARRIRGAGAQARRAAEGRRRGPQAAPGAGCSREEGRAREAAARADRPAAGRGATAEQRGRRGFGRLERHEDRGYRRQHRRHHPQLPLIDSTSLKLPLIE